MKYTNKYNLPSALYKACTTSNYKKTGDFSASQLCGPPQKYYLERRYDERIVVDASANLWMLLGNAVHDYLARIEGGDGENPEVKEAEHVHKFIVNMKDGSKRTVSVSGRTDLYYGQVDDYKLTGVFSYKMGVKPEWEAQQNIYGYLWRKAGFNVKSLNIQVILRDHMNSKVGTERGYPEIPFVRMSVPVWTDEEVEKFLHTRILLFLANENVEDANFTPCTEKERWTRPHTFAVMKEGRKSAVRLLPSRTEATKYIKTNELNDKHFIVMRAGKNVRCDTYCNARPFCDQLKREQLVGEPTDGEDV